MCDSWNNKDIKTIKDVKSAKLFPREVTESKRSVEYFIMLDIFSPNDDQMITLW